MALDKGSKERVKRVNIERRRDNGVRQRVGVRESRCERDREKDGEKKKESMEGVS